MRKVLCTAAAIKNVGAVARWRSTTGSEWVVCYAGPMFNRSMRGPLAAPRTLLGRMLLDWLSQDPKS